ncbi:MAG TPA: carbon storage regulator CsrA [Bacteroidota bacterium]|nr:carbon storage regulator CsrA [Bacteroidota bacterium]
MLILTRKAGETIRIGDSITVTVVQLNDGQIKLGIDAPKSISVHRGEVYDRIKAENREASKASVENTKLLAALLKTKNETQRL